MVVAHVVHDMRSSEEALGDRDSVREFSMALGLGFVQREIRVSRLEGNLEGNARMCRYRALADLAREQKCRFVATGHHADDQLETILMRLLRGAGSDGLRGIWPRRNLGRAGPHLIRPMLGVTRVEARDLCDRCGLVWREDATNLDVSRVRARLRRFVLPELLAIDPRAGAHAAASAELIRRAGAVVRARAREMIDRANRKQDKLIWKRSDLRGESPVVLAETIRRGLLDLDDGRGLDRLGHETLDQMARAIGEQSGETTRFGWGEASLAIDGKRVVLSVGDEGTDG